MLIYVKCDISFFCLGTQQVSYSVFYSWDTFQFALFVIIMNYKILKSREITFKKKILKYNNVQNGKDGN